MAQIETEKIQQHNTNSSMNTIFALVNSMIGGTMLTLPLLFRDSGIITSWIILVISGYISRKTCDIYIKHLAHDEDDIQDSIKRILKGKWYEFFCLITGIYLIMLNVLYIVLINDQLYNLVGYLAYKGAHGPSTKLASKAQFYLGFQKFSEQWLAIATFIPLLALLLIKDLTILIKMTAVGVWSVITYFIFVAYVFFDNIKHIHLSEIKLFSWNIGNLAGTAALAFTIHTVVAPIMKRNQNQKNNSRDLSISYVAGTFVYSFIGLCGCMAIYNKTSCAKNAQTIIDCFPIDAWQPFIVSMMYLLGLVTVFPCFLDVSRQRLFQAFTKDEIPDKKRHIFNVSFMLIAFLFEILAPYIKLSDIMNLNGAIFCFFFVYLIPLALHLKCYYDESRKTINSSSILTNEQLLEDQNKCGHSQKDIDYMSKNLRFALYGIILVIGVATMVYGVYSSIRTFAGMNK